MNCLKILIVSQHFYPENFRVNSIASSLATLGFDVTVLTGVPNYPAGKVFNGYAKSWLKWDSYNGVRILRVPIFLRGKASNLNLILNYISFVVSAIIFGIWRLKKEYDVVFCYATSPILQAIPAIFIAKKNNASMVLNLQDLWPESVSATNRIHSSLVLWLLSKIVGWIYHHSQLILMQSEAFKNSILRLSPYANLRYWPNSVDPVFYRFRPDQIPRDLDMIYAEDLFTITFAGNVGSAQSIETIIEAAEMLSAEKGIRIVVLGDGSRRSWALMQKEQKKLVNLFFPGAYPESVMPIVYQRSSCLLVTLAKQDIFSWTVPNKIQGYLATGRPIIGSLDGVGAEVIRSANAGFIAPAENPSILAELIVKASKMPQVSLDELGQNGKLFFMAHFEHEMLMNRLADIFKGLARS